MGVGSIAEGSCCLGDSPDCGCFVDTGAWDPHGPDIQGIAHDTVGTRESCLPNGGKPYYQVQLGIDSRASAQWIACLSGLDVTDYVPRDAWCSETVSFWHRQAGIPYSRGYRNGGIFLDWQLDTTYAIQTFYVTEESMGGRGRWIDWYDLDYEDLKLGENIPLPGSYVLIRKYDAAPGEWDGGSHSMMIDEMTIYRTTSGRVIRVEATILEGNSGNRVRDDRVLDDFLSLTPAGDKWLGGNRKIVGFGVDLDSRGRPIYTESKLHWVTVRETRVFVPRHPKVRDPVWNKYFAPLVKELVRYGKLARRGPRVTGEGFSPKGIPDTRIKWAFPRNGATVEIDLRAVHPVPIKGLILVWEGYVPRGIVVEWAGNDRRFRNAGVPDMKGIKGTGQGAYPVPVVFGKSGVKVRFVRIYVPAQVNRATLKELRFIFDWGPGEDTEMN